MTARVGQYNFNSEFSKISDVQYTQVTEHSSVVSCTVGGCSSCEFVTMVWYSCKTMLSTNTSEMSIYIRSTIQL